MFESCWAHSPLALGIDPARPAAAPARDWHVLHARAQPVGGGDDRDDTASRQLGMMAAVVSRWDEAERHFKDALEMDTVLRFPYESGAAEGPGRVAAR